MIKRTAIEIVREIIEQGKKMGFVSGPRQVGKTTLAKQYQTQFGQGLYLNWDIPTHQKRILTDPLFFEKENRDPGKPFLVVLDEIHKYARWKNFLKGSYDQGKEDFRFLITGSGRLELFKKGGDSLIGRYFSVPLFPLGVGELKGKLTSLKDFKNMLESPPSASADFPNPLPGELPPSITAGSQSARPCFSGRIFGMPALFGRYLFWSISPTLSLTGLETPSP